MRSGFLRCAAHKGVSSFGRNDAFVLKLERTGNGQGAEWYGLRGSDGFGGLNSSGSFAALRMTTGTVRNRRRQLQGI